jgi:type IV fimbrial biogenesis protein FimT
VLNRVPTRSKLAGFTLAELLIAIAVLSVLVSLGMPSFFTMLRNAELRGVAESIANGMQRARAEAVSRNTFVHFGMTAGTTAWTVDLATGAGPTPIDARESSEGSNATVAGLASDGTAATKITFSPLGQITANKDASKTVMKVTIDPKSGGNQKLQVLVGSGGAARVCDPAYTSPHPRAC